MNEIVDGAQLLDHGRRQNERINVGLAHGAVERVERVAERQPGIDQRRHVGRAIGLEVDFGFELAFFRQRRIDVDAEGARHLQGFDDVQVMRPGFGEILPRMRRRIGADEIVLPVRRRARGVVVLQRLPVIQPLVAEDRTKVIQLAAVADQDVPIVMSDLVAKVAEQRAIGLVHRGTPVFPLGVVGLLERHRDHAVLVSGHDRSARWASPQTGQKIERQAFAPGFVLIGAAVERQLELEQACRTDNAWRARSCARPRHCCRSMYRGSCGYAGTPRKIDRHWWHRPSNCRRRNRHWHRSDRACPWSRARAKRRLRARARIISRRRECSPGGDRISRIWYFRNRAIARRIGIGKVSYRRPSRRLACPDLLARFPR